MPSQPIRLYTKGVVLGYRRSKHLQYPQWTLVRIEGVKEKTDTQFYLGKKVAWVYRAGKKNKDGSNIKVMWGKVATSHGNSGVVRCRFRHNLPPSAFGATIRVMMYPSNI
eukprot:TRINITY_DN185_c0_g1_i2.p1 TRINITY_DN185_c0_g1~~TRINITY_DN185_c0_g1_i2.p1  ORF type:complete len:110 (-),score=13.25 TRINITY_DN185_c0_g1_i2:222-551(-)